MSFYEEALRLQKEAGSERAGQLLSSIRERKLKWFQRLVPERVRKAFIEFSKSSETTNVIDFLSRHHQKQCAFEAGFAEGHKLAIKEIKKHTNKWYDKKTFVIKTSDIERVRRLLETFGIVFKPEQHDKGPFHYSAVADDLVLEIYPIVVDED